MEPLAIGTRIARYLHLALNLIYFIVLVSALPAPTFAAMSPNAVWEARNTNGSSGNGGCFVVGIGTASPANSVSLLIDSGSSPSNLWVNSTGYTFASADVMKYMTVTSGTGWTAGWYQILSVGISPGGVTGSAELSASPSAIGNANFGTFSLYPGVDRSQQASAQVTIDNVNVIATSAASTLTFSTSGTTPYSPSTADLGNCTQVTSGATAGVYYVANVSAGSGGTWTLTGANTLGTGSAIMAKMGGAMDSLNTIMTYFVLGNSAYVGNIGTYSLTAGISSSLACSYTSVADMCRIYGYNTTRGDNGSNDTGIPTLQIASGSSGVTMFTDTSAIGLTFAHFALDCNNTTSSAALSGAFLGDDLKIKGCTSSSAAAAAITSGRLEGSEVTGNSGLAGVSVTTGSVRGNYVHANSTTGVTISSTGSISYNQITDNSTSTCTTCDGVAVTTGGSTISNNTIAGNGRDGINVNTANIVNTDIKNNALANNGINTTGYNLVCGTSPNPAHYYTDGNGYFQGAAAGNRNNCDDQTTILANGPYAYLEHLDTITSTNPFTNETGGDYSLAVGSAFIATGRPGAFSGLTSPRGYMDLGALQHQATGGASFMEIGN